MTGTIIAVFNTGSNTTGAIQAFNDGIVSVAQTSFDFSLLNGSIVVNLSRMALGLANKFNATPIAKTYKLALERNSKLIATLPSLLYGSKQTIQDDLSDFEVYSGRAIFGQPI